ncbi:hypothetical protein AU468_08215 [Alkalispirochaeta sphaeroplastigenens]|uniref:Phosphoglycerate mutase n=1 Tax=Alkalispirochaeta sphaeroplastigenens TaxID=1187066 RepID=A0A2S4JP32_9SPIO|nr:histidine phosphatase family protein [Alkalispirochaeta sphaeroplastigenens]POR01294.1 hypothetical protein AU468_08215 [Alkalispirochaeta sphaeroplastigenens]
MVTEICLVRHGETDWNARALIQGSTDIPLNDTGRNQARAAAGMLQQERWDALYASTMIRAIETAEIIGEVLSLGPVTTDHNLREREYGIAEGMDIAERYRRFGEGPIPGAEEWDQVRKRGLEALEAIRRANPGQRVLAVAHGGLINALLGVISAGEIGSGKTVLKNASTNLIVWDGSWKVRWYNRTAEAA